MRAGRDRDAEIRLRRLAGLTAPLEAVKRRDAGALAEVQSAIQAIDDRIAALRAEIYTAESCFDPMDLDGAAAFASWVAAARARIARWEAEREALRPAWEAARETLLRSNGEAEAVKRLSAR
ncbi:MAG: hypothetical protein AAFW46_13940 [Pseudomonadota bacterium]